MQRIIVKIGTHTLLGKDGQIDAAIAKKYAAEIKKLNQQGYQIIIVTSGAVAQGKFFSQNKNLNKKALAAVGQIHLMSVYKEAFAGEFLSVSQLLLGKNDILDKNTYNTLRDTIENLLENDVVPLINENDAITNGTTVGFRDNDSLAVVVALAVDAQMIINLSHVDGLFDKDPEKYADAKIIHQVDSVTKELVRLCDNSASKQGSGGMIAKLRAMRLASSFGVTMVIANGREDNIIEKVIKGEQIGTVFLSHPKSSLKARDRWIVSAKISTGSLVIDNGAATALKKGKSLLAVGVKKIYGTFKKGEIIDVLDLGGDLLAIGIVKIDYQDLQKLFSKKETIYNQEVIHANDLIIL